MNEFTSIAADYDGFIFGSPVFFAGMNGNLMSFMDRVFFSASADASSYIQILEHGARKYT